MQKIRQIRQVYEGKCPSDMLETYKSCKSDNARYADYLSKAYIVSALCVTLFLLIILLFLTIVICAVEYHHRKKRKRERKRKQKLTKKTTTTELTKQTVSKPGKLS